MKTLIKYTAAALLSVTLALPALAEGTEATIDATTQDKLTAELTRQGYDVRKVGSEDGMIEVYAVKDGKTYEMYFDSALKLVKSNQG